MINENWLNFLLLAFRIFADLIIGEVNSPLLSDRPFFQVDIASLMPQRFDNQGNNRFGKKAEKRSEKLAQRNMKNANKI